MALATSSDLGRDWTASRLSRPIAVTDSASDAAIFQRIGQRTGGEPSQNGLGEVYYFRSVQPAMQADLAFARLAPLVRQPANQAADWKGEWWRRHRRRFTPHPICQIVLPVSPNDQNLDWRATITLQNASSSHPGSVNVLFSEGSVRFIKSSVGYQHGMPLLQTTTVKQSALIRSDV